MDEPVLSVQVADPSYGPGLDPGESEHAAVDLEVEEVPWEPLAARPATGGGLAFIDGVQQVEA